MDEVIWPSITIPQLKNHTFILTVFFKNIKVQLNSFEFIDSHVYLTNGSYILGMTLWHQPVSHFDRLQWRVL